MATRKKKAPQEEILQEEAPQEEASPTYPVAAGITSISHGGQVYAVKDGHIQCKPETADKLRKAGMLHE